MSARSLIPWAMAACFAFAAAWLGRLYLASNLEAEGLRTQHALAELALKSADQQLEAERILARAQLAQLDLTNLKIAVLVAATPGGATEARGVAVWNAARQEGVLALENMPALSPDQRLELWLIEAATSSKPVSAGVLEVGASGATRVSFKPTMPVDAVAKFVVSREKNDGVRAHASPAVIVMTGDSR